MQHWWQVEAAVLVLYLAIIAAVLAPQSWIIAGIALVWYFVGSALQSAQRPFTYTSLYYILNTFT